MDKEKSIELTSTITQIINTENPVFDYKKGKIKDRCVYSTDKELEHVLNRFLHKYGLTFDEEYKKGLFENAKKLDSSFLKNNPYLKAIHFENKRINDYTLYNAQYQKGELLLYDMPDLLSETVYPKLAFFTSDVSFPSLYEGNMPWMSVCPSEIYSMQQCIDHAHGNVLVLGLGLGYYPFMISLKEEVTSITVVEVSKEVIELFQSEIYPMFPDKNMRIIKADGIDYINRHYKDFDYCFVDIWEGMEDGYPFYKEILDMDIDIEMDFWIEDSLKYYGEMIETKEK